MIELSILLRCPPATVYQLDEVELATMLDVLDEARRRG